MDLEQQAAWRKLIHTTHPKAGRKYLYPDFLCYYCEYELGEAVYSCS
jgi:uncharacterized OB-fold protein